MDEIAKIYLRYADVKYRIKVFEKSIGIERQFPDHESNLMFDRTRYANLYDDNDGSWNPTSFSGLISDYERHVANMNAKLDAEDN